jgi:hypothetical protein
LIKILASSFWAFWMHFLVWAMINAFIDYVQDFYWSGIVNCVLCFVLFVPLLIGCFAFWLGVIEVIKGGDPDEAFNFFVGSFGNFEDHADE